MPVNTGGGLFFKSGINLAGLRSGVSSAKGIIAGFAKNISKMDVFAGIGISAAIVFNKLRKAAYNFSRDLDHSMREVATISDAVKMDFQGMTDQIVEMSTRGPDSALNLSKALYQIVSAGNDGAKAMSILNESMKLAVATVTETEVAADALTSILNAYGDAAGSVTHVSDALMSTIKNAKTTMEELGPSITTVTGLAAQAGLAFDDLMAIISTGAKTLKTPIMMTGIRGMLTAIIKPTKDAADMAKELGIQFDTAALRGKGFVGFLKDVWQATDGSVEKLAELFPNVRGLTGLLSVAVKEGEEFNRQLRNIQQSSGMVTEAFEVMMESPVNQFKILSNNMMKIVKPVGDALLSVASGAAKAINWLFKETKSETEKWVDSLEDVTEVVKARRDRIQELIGVMDSYIEKEQLTTKEERDLLAVERQLAIYLPEVADAMRDNAEATDILKMARKGLTRQNDELIKREIQLTEARLRLAQENLREYQRQEDEASQRVKDISKRMEDRARELRQKAGFVLSTDYVMPPEAFARAKAQFKELIEIDGEYLTLQNRLAVATAERTQKLIPLQNEIDSLMQRLRILRGEETEAPELKPEIETPKAAGLNLENFIDSLEKRQEIFETYQKILSQKSAVELEVEMPKLTESARGYVEWLRGLREQYAGNEQFIIEITKKMIEADKLLSEYRGEGLEEWLKDNQTFQERRLEVERKYNELRSEVQDEYQEEERERILVRLDEAEQEALNKIEIEQNQLQVKNDIEEAKTEFAKAQNRQQVQDVIDSLLEKAEKYKENKDLYEQIQRQITSLQKESLEKIVQNTERMNMRQLISYRNYLQELAELYKGNAGVLQFILSKLDEINSEIWDRQEERIQNIGQAIENLGDIFERFDEDLADVAREAGSFVKDIGFLIEDLSTGDITGAIASGISILGSFFTMLDAIFGSTDEQTKEIESTLERINNLLEEQDRLVNRMIGEERLQALIDYWYMVQTELGALQIQRDLGLGWGTEEEEAYQELLDKFHELKDEIGEALTGTTISSIADAITQGFKDGLKSAEDFAGTFEDMMAEAMVNAFKRKMITDQLEFFYDRFLYAAQEGLTPAEIEDLEEYWNSLIEQARLSWEQLEELADTVGIDLFGTTQREGLIGAIKGITEETAGILAGQFMAIRIDVEEINDNVRLGADQIRTISDNVETIARNTSFNKYLKSIDERLRAMSGRGRDYLRSRGEF